MLKLTLILILTFLTSCMTLKAIEMELKTPSRVLCISDGEVVYDGTPSGVSKDGSFTYIEDKDTGQMLKTTASCTHYY